MSFQEIVGVHWITIFVRRQKESRTWHIGRGSTANQGNGVPVNKKKYTCKVKNTTLANTQLAASTL